MDMITKIRVPTPKTNTAFLWDGMERSILNIPDSRVAIPFFTLCFFRSAPKGIRISPKIKNGGRTIYVNSPKYRLGPWDRKSIANKKHSRNKNKTAMKAPR